LKTTSYLSTEYDLDKLEFLLTNITVRMSIYYSSEFDYVGKNR
jgi:hypothetical protein